MWKRKSPYAVEAKQLLWEIRHILQIKSGHGFAPAEPL